MKMVLMLLVTNMLATRLVIAKVNPNIIRVEIINKKAYYHRTDILRLKIINLTAKKVFVLPGLEVFDNGVWKEISENFEHPMREVGIVHPLNKYINLKMPLRDIPFKGSISPPYRLFVKYSLSGKVEKAASSKKESFAYFKISQ